MHHKPAPTLIDTFYRASFARKPVFGWRSNAAMRERLQSARKFVLDDAMSSYLGDLSHVGFGSTYESQALNSRLADQFRVSARAPHQTVWIEYNLHAELARSNEFVPRQVPISEAPIREGWLIEQHPSLDYAFRLHVFSQSSDPDAFGYEHFTFPVCYAWTVTDDPLPWPLLVAHTTDNERYSSEAYLGLPGYHSEHIGIVKSELINDPTSNNWDVVQSLVKEWMGIIRRMWALLATIDDLPMLTGDVRQSKGFVARGSYRRFLDHKTITLNIPGKADRIKVARQLTALMRRRRHQVRGHWREDWRSPPSARCPALLATTRHQWTAEQRCDVCGGHRIWVHEHDRGDAALGFVTHDYSLKHEVQQP